MNRKLKTTLKIVAAAILVAALAGAALTFAQYQRLVKDNPAPTLLSSFLEPSGQAALGSTVKAVHLVKSPWTKRPLEADVTPGKGSQSAGPTVVERTGRGWGFDTWRVVCPLQAYALGDIPAGSASLAFDDAPDKLALKLPTFKSVEIPGVSPDSLALAGKLDRKVLDAQRRHKLLLAAAAAALLLGLGLWLLLRRKTREATVRKLPDWVVALNNLRDLRDSLKSGRLLGLECVAALTDIVRDYLEKRFRLRAPHQTTEEFLRGLDNPSSPLKNTDRNFLRDFMTAADMVKFARVDAPAEQIEEAIERAATLVKESAPQEEQRPRNTAPAEEGLAS